MLLTAHLGVLLCLARTADESTRAAVQLSEAVASRDVIGQAKGILMERGRITAAEAFDVLRTASQRLNRKLRDIAEELARAWRDHATAELSRRPAPSCGRSGRRFVRRGRDPADRRAGAHRQA